METLATAVSWIFWTIVSVIWWVVGTLLWALVWIVLPFAVAGYIALRIAEAALGREVVRAWLKAKAMTYGAGLWLKLRVLMFAATALPFRVTAWFIVYAIWHSIVSVLWTPRWKPWPRAWAKRWGERAAARGRSSPAKAPAKTPASPRPARPPANSR